MPAALTPARIARWGGQKRISKHVPRLGLCGGVPSLADAAAFALLGSSLRRCASDDGGGLLAGSMIRADRRVAMRCLVDSFAEPILLGSSPFLKLHFADLSLSACSTFAPVTPGLPPQSGWPWALRRCGSFVRSRLGCFGAGLHSGLRLLCLWRRAPAMCRSHRAQPFCRTPSPRL